MFSTYLFAQNTYYFKQVKIVSKNGKVTSGRGGQFISFYKDICYESNKKGETVRHGMLDQVKETNNNVIEYRGKSYWGKVVFKFNKDLSRLNVLKPDGTIIVYSKSMAPSGVTTCSLIRNNGSHVGYSSQPISTGGYNGGYNNSTISMGNLKGSNSTRQKTKVTKKCAYCSGKGERIQHEYVSTFGQSGPRVYCSKCNQSWNYGTVHAHHRCNHCNGTGVYEYEY